MHSCSDTWGSYECTWGHDTCISRNAAKVICFKSYLDHFDCTRLGRWGSISGLRVRVVDLFISWILRVINMWRLGSALSKDLWIVLSIGTFSAENLEFKRRLLRGLVSVSLRTFNTDNNNETQRAEGSSSQPAGRIEELPTRKKEESGDKAGKRILAAPGQEAETPKQTHKQWLQSHRKKSSKQNMLKDSSLWIQKHQKQSGKKQFLEVFHNF